MNDAVSLFQSPDAVPFAEFVEQMSKSPAASGPKWKALRDVMATRFMRARADYLKALDAARADRDALERRHAGNVAMREQVIEQLAALTKEIEETYPAAVAAADAAPAAVVAEANASLTADEVDRIAAALRVYLDAFKA